MQKKFCFAIIGLLIAISPSLAQTDTTKYKYIGLGVGMNLTKTDLSESYQKPTSSFTAHIQFAKNKKFNSAVQLAFGQSVSENPEVKLLDQSEFQINHFALAKYQSLSFEAIYMIYTKYGITLAVSQGFGFMRFNVLNEKDVALIDVLSSRAQGESYSGFSLLLPSSISIRYLLKNGYGIRTQFTIQNVLTDYLDNISVFGNASNNDNIISFQIAAFKRLSF